MNKCSRWKECLHNTCYHITDHSRHPNCLEHECFLEGRFQICSCVHQDVFKDRDPSKLITHKVVEAEVITKRTILCGEEYTVNSLCSLYWKEVNCTECLCIGALRKSLGVITHEL